MAAAAVAPPVGLKVDLNHQGGSASEIKAVYKEARTTEIKNIIQEFLQSPDVKRLTAKLNKTPLKEPSKEAKQLINRIHKCSDNAYHQILDVPQNAGNADVLKAWRILGCILRPCIKAEDAGLAFCRLINAAMALNVNFLDIDEVLFWDGQEDLQQLDDNDENPLEEEEIKKPPLRVTTIYKEATPYLHDLIFKPEDTTLRDAINKLNCKIMEGNMLKKLRNSALYRWTISTPFFRPHYSEALKRYHALESDPNDSEAKKEIATERDLINKEIEKYHYPRDWTIPTAEEFLNARNRNNKDTEPKSEPTQEAKDLIEHIMKYQADDYDNILGVTEESDGDEVEHAWISRGCLIHEKYIRYQDADKAFKRLRNAAEHYEVDEDVIKEVIEWNGTENLLGGQPKEDAVPPPPERVMTIYQEATAVMEQLKKDPDDGMSQSKIEDLNEKIRQENIANGMNESEENQWEISTPFFVPHYKMAYDKFRILESDPENKVALEAIAKTKAIIDLNIKKCHYPESWTIATKEGQGGKPETASPDYPWKTRKAADGSLILGVRRIGRFGTQVCVEAEEDGRLIRRHKPASEVGLLEVEQYKKEEGHLNLAENQAKWSSKDRGSFKELLWITKSMVKRRNTAANRRDPNADCCVVLTPQGMQMLTVTSLCNVLGVASARAQIETVCERDGIEPPWEAGAISEYFDLASLEKNRGRRTAMRDEQAQANSADISETYRQRLSSRGFGQEASKTHSDKKTVADPSGGINIEDTKQMSSKIDALVAGLAKLLKTISPNAAAEDA